MAVRTRLTARSVVCREASAWRRHPDRRACTDTGKEHLEHARIPEQIRVVTQRVIEDATLAVLANPGDGVVLVVAKASAVAPALLLVDRGGINGQQDPQSFAREWRLEPIEFVDQLERFAAERPRNRMIGVFDWTMAFSSDSRWDAPVAPSSTPNSSHFGEATLVP